MKKLILLLLYCPLLATGQATFNLPRALEFEQIDSTNSTHKENMFKARRALGSMFEKFNEVLAYEDSSQINLLFIIKSYKSIDSPTANVYANLAVNVKDNKYKILIHNFKKPNRFFYYGDNRTLEGAFADAWEVKRKLDENANPNSPKYKKMTKAYNKRLVRENEFVSKFCNDMAFESIALIETFSNKMKESNQTW